MQTRVFRALNATLNPNTVPACEKFRRLSDEFWGCLAQHYTQTIYHPAGTAKMGPRTDPMAVVDARLQVYGVSKLRVVDCSIMPTIVSGNTVRQRNFFSYFAARFQCVAIFVECSGGDDSREGSRHDQSSISGATKCKCG